MQPLTKPGMLYPIVFFMVFLKLVQRLVGDKTSYVQWSVTKHHMCDEKNGKNRKTLSVKYAKGAHKLLSHLLIARCDIGVQLSVRSSVRPSTIYVKVLTL